MSDTNRQIVQIGTDADFYEVMGFEGPADFKEKTGLQISVSSNVYQSGITIHYVDKFYASVLANGSYVPVAKTGIELEDLEADYKKKARYKKSKINKLEGMRVRLKQQLVKELNESYGIPLELIKEEEFVFEQYSRITIGEAIFSYSSTFSKDEINLQIHLTYYEAPNKRVEQVLAHYYGYGLKEVGEQYLLTL